MLIGSDIEYPVLAMQRWYEEHSDEVARPLLEDMQTYLVNGFVLSTPYLFIMARPVKHDASYTDIINPYYTFRQEDRDCWHVSAAAGDISRIWEYYPVDYEWAHWVNKGRVYVQKMDRARRVIESFRVDKSWK